MANIYLTLFIHIAWRTQTSIFNCHYNLCLHLFVITYSACNFNQIPGDGCEFPHAFVPLTRRPNLLMLGQSYKVYLHLEMPESQRNRDLGMFMVCADMRDETTELLDHSCRTVMLQYKSSLIRAIRTWLLSPLYVFAIQEEKQRIVVELYPDYIEDQVTFFLHFFYLFPQFNNYLFRIVRFVIFSSRFNRDTFSSIQSHFKL